MLNSNKISFRVWLHGLYRWAEDRRSQEVISSFCGEEIRSIVFTVIIYFIIHSVFCTKQVILLEGNFPFSTPWSSSEKKIQVYFPLKANLIRRFDNLHSKLLDFDTQILSYIQLILILSRKSESLSAKELKISWNRRRNITQFNEESIFIVLVVPAKIQILNG